MGEISSLISLLQTARAMRKAASALTGRDLSHISGTATLEQLRQTVAPTVHEVPPAGDVIAPWSTAVANLSVPSGWETMTPEMLQWWRNQVGKHILGGIERSGPTYGIIDVAEEGKLDSDDDPTDIWLDALDPSTSRIRQQWQEKGEPITVGPGNVRVTGQPAMWFYNTGIERGTRITHAHALIVTPKRQVIHINLIAQSVHFALCENSFWTVLATLTWPLELPH